jgi:enoyl-CoA hydratase/carnithine racemase
MACDLIFAADTARLGQTEVKLGLVTGWGGCHRLAQFFAARRPAPSPPA